MSGPRVVIEMEVAHAEAVADLLDLATRMHMGQLGEIASLVRQQAISARRGDQPAKLTEEDLDQLTDALNEAKGVLGHPRGSHFGIGSTALTAVPKRGYEVYKALRQALHQHLRPEVRHTVDSVGVSVRYADGAVPTARVVQP